MRALFREGFNLAIPAIVLSFPGYYLFACYLERTEFPILAGLYLTLFALFLLMYRHRETHFKTLVGAGIIFRCILLAGLPELSQDFYRFLWDGELIRNGINPYLYRPEELLDSVLGSIPNARQLFDGMGSLSASHFSNYPPANQFFFYLAALLGGSSLTGKVMVLKLIMLLADLGILYFGSRILRLLEKPVYPILLYFLNPFVILELSGNLHFEGVMMFLFLAGLWFLFNKKYIYAAIAVGLSISVKLIPLLFLPLLFMYIIKGRWFPERKCLFQAIGFSALTLGVFSLSFLPFFSISNLDHFTASVGLWFSKFEFNASLYYLVRAVGYWIKGYNIIGSVAPWIPVFTAISVLALCLRKENKTPQGLITSSLIAISIYLFISTTVHPWYLVTPLVLSVLINKKYVLLWTALVILSYAAYREEPFKESTLLLLLEYIPVFLLFFREMMPKNIIKAS